MALTVPNTFVAGTTAVASEVNDNFTAVKTFVDGLETDVTTLETKSPVITLAGDLTGSATLTNLGNATLTATIAANSVALGTDTTGNYVSNVAGGTGITVTHTPGEGSTPTVAVTANTYDAFGAASTAATNAATALSNHESDTTNIHGIADTSILVTTSGSQTLTNKTITTPLGIVKGDVGLGNVDNTSDANKPVSTATQTALNLKSNLASPTFTGTVVLPSTTSIGTVSSTEIGYVDGVTSAIQTQLDAKVAKSTLTTTGDIFYASAANTPARLPIGSNTNVLTVSGGVPVWAAAASGSGMTQLDTQTFTSSTTYTLSASAKIVIVEIVGGGGGGGGGARNTAANTPKGGGGGNGSTLFGYVLTVPGNISSGSVTVTIGAGGAGGAGSTVDGTAGTDGSNGGLSSFGAYGAFGGPLGKGGAASGNSAAPNIGDIRYSSMNAATSSQLSTGGYNLSSNGKKGLFSGGGGGAGGSASTGGSGPGGDGGSSETNANVAISLTSTGTMVANNSGGATGGTLAVGGTGTGRNGAGGGGGNNAGAGYAGGVGGKGAGGGGGGAGVGASGGTGGTGGGGEIKIWVFG